MPNELNQMRVGVTASRSVGNAVKRNWAKRRLRSAIASRLSELSPNWDIILIARPAILQAPYPSITLAITELLRRANILFPHES